ncbi:low temperature requirement protein A [Streptococcus dentasini]
MASLMKHKKVELTELFYDLVFVYGMSQGTSLIHHVHHGVIPWMNFISFSIGMIIMINSWMVQTVFTNRFGKNSLTNILFMFAQMCLLLISLAASTGEFTHQSFQYFYGPYAGISFLLLLQYLIEHVRAKEKENRLFIKQFFYILGLRTTGLLISVFLPMSIGLWVAAASILISWILPGLLTSRSAVRSEVRLVNFPHLVERLSLLVIITFGEMIIGIAKYFTPEALSVYSILIFSVVANLFMIYIVEIDHMIDVNKPVENSNSLIYWHYPIFFGLSFVTVSLGFLGEAKADNGFSIFLLYLGIILLLISLFGIQRFNKESHKITLSLIGQSLGIWLAGCLLSCLTVEHSFALVILAALTCALLAIVFVRFNLSHLE